MPKAMIAAGCFWGVEEYFRKLNGVIETKVGYSGGSLENPTYEDVCSGNTNHAEVVLIDYDDKKISYKEIVEHFWNCHDPTQINRQGLDIGSQYRSAIFYLNDEEKNIAEISKEELKNKNNISAVTEITKSSIFYLAEEYHQCFIKKRAKL